MTDYYENDAVRNENDAVRNENDAVRNESRLPTINPTNYSNIRSIPLIPPHSEPIPIPVPEPIDPSLSSIENTKINVPTQDELIDRDHSIINEVQKYLGVFGLGELNLLNDLMTETKRILTNPDIFKNLPQIVESTNSISYQIQGSGNKIKLSFVKIIGKGSFNEASIYRDNVDGKEYVVRKSIDSSKTSQSFIENLKHIILFIL